MIRHILAFGFAITISTNNFAQTTDSTKEQVLQNVVTRFFDALADLNAEKAKSMCTSDVAFLESGKVWNFDSLAVRIAARKERSTDFKRINKLSFIKTEIPGDAAWISYLNEAIITFNGKTTNVKWMESVVLVKDKTGWKISLLHSTELERTP